MENIPSPLRVSRVKDKLRLVNKVKSLSKN